MKKIVILFMVFVALLSSQVFAQTSLSDGSYTMNDGKMEVNIVIKSMPDGRYFIEGGGANKQGSRCMMNGIGTFKSNGFEFGYNCILSVTNIDAQKFELKDTAGCVPCDPGAYVSGTYQKK
ncbi:MAG: hypothetical protein N3D15_03550 [Syntrophorhabdaceae bacterium]|nr:hypothetical protein [Syntrophorhabdaceae bacterium]